MSERIKDRLRYTASLALFCFWLLPLMALGYMCAMIVGPIYVGATTAIKHCAVLSGTMQKWLKQ